MKWLKRLGVALLCLPVMLVVVFVIYEIFGMCMNHIATKEQTDTLRGNLENEISDIEIVNVYWKPGIRQEPETMLTACLPSRFQQRCKNRK